jgi:Fe-S cluster assembly iron-binding protein IscA
MRMIQVTDKAEKKLLPMLAENSGKVLRIVLEGFG